MRWGVLMRLTRVSLGPSFSGVPMVRIRCLNYFCFFWERKGGAGYIRGTSMFFGNAQMSRPLRWQLERDLERPLPPC